MLSRKEPPLHAATTDWACWVLQTVVTLLSAHSLLPSSPTGPAKAADLRGLQPRKNLLGLCTWRSLSQLKSSPWRLSVPFCGVILLLHGCSRNNLGNEVFPPLPACSCSSRGWVLFALLMALLVELATPAPRTARGLSAVDPVVAELWQL
jgi:hypothetical protein